MATRATGESVERGRSALVGAFGMVFARSETSGKGGEPPGSLFPV